MIKKGLKMRMATENEKLKLAELLISEYGKNVTMKERIELLNHVSESNIVAYDLEGSKEYKTILVQMMIGMSYQTKEIEKLTEEFLIDNQGNVLGYVKSENKTISVNEIDSIELA
jgi:hypothetical protein